MTTHTETKEADNAQPVQSNDRPVQESLEECHGTQAEDPIRSRKRPIWHVFVITFATLTLNVPFWIYKTCKVLKNHARDAANNPMRVAGNPEIPVCESIAKYAKCRPWLNGLISILPFVNCFVIATLFRDIAAAIPNEENFARKNPTFAGLALTLAMASLWMLGQLEGPAFLLFTLVSIPLAIAQSWLNTYWDKVEPLEYRDQTTFVGGGFSPIELISIIVGAMAVALVVLGFSLQTP